MRDALRAGAALLRPRAHRPQPPLWAGFVVEGPTRRFYHAGDTGYFDGFAEIGRASARSTSPRCRSAPTSRAAIMAVVHVNPEEAVQAALDLRATRAVGMHFGTFDLTDEPLDEPPRRFLAEARARGLEKQRLRHGDRRDARVLKAARVPPMTRRGIVVDASRLSRFGRFAPFAPISSPRNFVATNDEAIWLGCAVSTDGGLLS